MTDAAVAPNCLAGVRVLEMGSFIAGPFAGQLLGDYGADVIKVEPPEGDPTRRYGPPFVPPLDAEAAQVLQLQQGYQAASKMVSVINSLSDALLNMV